MHGGLPCVTDGLLPSAGLIGAVSRSAPPDPRSGVDPATRFPAEAATCTGSATFGGRRLSGRDRRAAGPVCRQVFGLADTDLAIHLAPRLPRLAPSARDGARFHLPLRGSSGFAPDSLLTRPRPTRDVIEAGTDRTQAIVSGGSRQRIILCLESCIPRRVSGGKRLRGMCAQARRRACSAASTCSMASACFAARASSSSIASSTASTVVGPPPNSRIAVRATWRVSYQA